LRTLKKATRYVQNKTEVKFWQAALNQFEGAGLSVDGDFGEKSVAATEAFQKKHGIAQSGVADEQTQQKMGFRITRNKSIVVLEIPFNKLSAANTLVKNGQGYNCERFAREMGYDIVMNGAFFQMSNRKIVQLVVSNGAVINWGMGLRGIAFPRAWSKATYSHVNDVVGKPFDLQGGAPFLVSDYRIDQQGIADFKNPAIMNSKTRRGCLGITATSFFLMFSIGNITLYDMANEAINQHIQYVIGLDGGGSQSLFMGGAWVITTDGRLIPEAIGLRIEKVIPPQERICPTCFQLWR
jgi:hypothetical protein